MGKTVDAALIGQFVQDASIAERFAVYYELFSKYRSDYQVSSILAGTCTPEVVERAQQAAFDERLAVLNLILDAVETQTAQALESEAVVMEVRDALRVAKNRIVGGEAPDSVLEELAAQRLDELETRNATGTTTPEEVRLQKLVVGRLRALERVGATEVGGEAAFDALGTAYAQLVDDMRDLANNASLQLENAFSFVAQTFGNEREMLVFVSDLSTRPTTMRFVNAFGSSGYTTYSERLAVQEHRDSLLDRANELTL